LRGQDHTDVWRADTVVANFVGLLTAILLLLLVLNLNPFFQMAPVWQFGCAMVVVAVNLFTWWRKPVPPMSLREAAMTAGVYGVWIALWAAADIFVGRRPHTIMEFMLHGGLLGGWATAFLFCFALFVIVPTLARSL